ATGRPWLYAAVLHALQFPHGGTGARQGTPEVQGVGPRCAGRPADPGRRGGGWGAGNQDAPEVCGHEPLVAAGTGPEREIAAERPSEIKWRSRARPPFCLSRHRGRPTPVSPADRIPCTTPQTA